MIQKNSYLVPADKCGVWLVNTFHLYKGFNRRCSRFGDYIKVSVKVTKPANWLLKKSKRKALIIRTKKETTIIDGSCVFFYSNNAVILKKRLTPEGSEIFGPIIRTFKKKKFINSFSGLI
jgi:ribosomal protein L14